MATTYLEAAEQVATKIIIDAAAIGYMMIGITTKHLPYMFRKIRLCKRN